MYFCKNGKKGRKKGVDFKGGKENKREKIINDSNYPVLQMALTFTEFTTSEAALNRFSAAKRNCWNTSEIRFGHLSLLAFICIENKYIVRKFM